MTPDEILKLWRDYEGLGSDAVVAFARAVELAERERCLARISIPTDAMEQEIQTHIRRALAVFRERCIKVCNDLAFEHESYSPPTYISKHLTLGIRTAQANTARMLADKIRFL